MKQKIIFWTLLISISLVLISKVLSQPLIGPHDGAVKKAGVYYIEMKSLHQEVHAYLLDKELNPIGNKAITCEIRIVYPDNSCLTKPLKAFGSDGFSSGIPSMQFVYCSVFFNVYGKVVSAQFENNTLIVQN